MCDRTPYPWFLTTTVGGVEEEGGGVPPSRQICDRLGTVRTVRESETISGLSLVTEGGRGVRST